MDTLVGFHTEGNGHQRPNVRLNLAHFRQIHHRDGDHPRRPTSPCSSSTTTTTPAPGTASATAHPDNNLPHRQTHRHHPPHHPLHRPHVLRRRDRHDHPHPHAQRRCQRPHRHHRLAQRKRPRRRAHPHAVDARARHAAGFSTNPHTWLPIGADYPTVNVATETADPTAPQLVHAHSSPSAAANPALHDGGIVMLDTTNPSVLSYAPHRPGRRTSRRHLRQLHRPTPDRPPRPRPAGIPSTTLKTLLTTRTST